MTSEKLGWLCSIFLALTLVVTGITSVLRSYSAREQIEAQKQRIEFLERKLGQ